jgi:hypothetical protein
MTTHTGYLAPRAIWPTSAPTSPSLSLWNLDRSDGRPYLASAQARAGALTSSGDVGVYPPRGAHDGARMPSFADGFYHRIHVVPLAAELGNIVSTQVITVLVWNAWMLPRTLQEIAGIEEGVSVAGAGALPDDVGALVETEWVITVSPDGPSVLDVALHWIFDGADSLPLRLSGNRIVAWPFVPDWSEPVRETLAWLTDVMTSRSGATQRRALRTAPRRNFHARMIAEGRERALFDLQLASWGGRTWAMPIWPDIQFLASPVAAGATLIACSTPGRDFAVGSLVLLRGESAFQVEAAEVEAIASGSITLARPLQKSWPAGTRLYPARIARLAEQPEMLRKTDRLLVSDVFFDVVEACDWAAAAPATVYRGLPVLTERPDEDEDLTSQYLRLLGTIDNDVGVPAVIDRAGHGFSLRAHRWLVAGIAEHTALRSLLYWLRGRQRALWVPTHADDMQLAAPSTGTLLNIQAVGYTRFGLNKLGRRDIRIELASGTNLHRRIVDATEGDDDNELLVLDTPLPSLINPGDVRRICYLALMRMSEDEIEIEHVTDIQGIARAAITWQGERDELEAA